MKYVEIIRQYSKVDFMDVYMSGVSGLYRRALSDKWVIKQSLYQRLKGKITNNYHIKFISQKTKFRYIIVLRPKDWNIYSDIG